MVQLLSFQLLLAIILHTSSSLHAHALAKQELPLPSDDDHKFIPDLSISRGNSWLEQDGQIKYREDYSQNANDRLQSRLLSSLIADFKGLGKQHPEIQFSQPSQPQDNIPQFEQQHGKDYGEEEREEEGESEEGEQESDEQNGEQWTEQQKKEHGGNYEEEYRRRYEEKHRKPEVHLFGSPGLQRRGNTEQSKHQNSPTIELGARDRQRTPGKQSNAKTTDDNPLISRVERPATSDFSYIHPEEWSRDNPECSGRLQSPVNLDSDKLVRLDVPSSLIWTGYWNQPENLTITDNGHSVELSGTWDEKKAPSISGGPLVGDYTFAQLHFHWGPKDSVGSEHTINNISFPMEMHMVHYKRDYGSLNNALKHDDGLAVVAFLFERYYCMKNRRIYPRGQPFGIDQVDAEPSMYFRLHQFWMVEYPALANLRENTAILPKIGETVNFGVNFLEDSLSKIQNKPKVAIPVKPYPLAFLHFIFHEDYASYIGSLTTPPCREIVTWLVSSTPITISRKQLESFRKISNKWPEKENYRPRQALNGRSLYYVAH